MATVSTIKALRGTVDWDEAWANRRNSGAGFKWSITTATGGRAPGVTISNPNALITNATFTSIGTYKATLYASDGAMVAKASETFEIRELGVIEIYLTGEATIPVTVTIPTGSAVFQKLDAILDIDTSGSMGGTINTAKSRAAEIVNALFSGGRSVRCAIGKVGTADESPSHPVLCPLTSNLSQIQSALNPMSANSPGWDEVQYLSIVSKSNGLGWETGALHVYMMFTDELLGTTGATKAQALAALQAKNIVLLYIQSGGVKDSGLEDVARSTGGYHYSLDSAASAIVSKIEDALRALSEDLTVELVADSSAPPGLVKKIVPYSCDIGAISGNYFVRQRPGSRFTFNVTFDKSGIRSGSGVQRYTFKLIIRETSTNAVIDEVPVRITVNFDET